MPPTSPPPEAALIAGRRSAPPRQTIRSAAARAGISETRWRQIERGDRAPDTTLAAMARAVGVTPAELDAAGRGDAAAELRAMLRTGPADRGALDERLRHIEEMLAAVRNDLDNDDDGRPKGGSVNENPTPAWSRPA